MSNGHSHYWIKMLRQLSAIKDKLPTLKYSLPKQERNRLKRIYRQLDEIYPTGTDAWGLRLSRAKQSLEWIYPLYKYYFRVRTFGRENVADTPYIVVSNHSGQIAIDGMLICTSFVSELTPPRVLRPMVERFFTGLPFIGPWAAEGGAVLGDRTNCINLLKRQQSVLVFPEGVRGITKSPKDFYQLQPFTHGFYRMALATQVPILPVTVIGAEEFYPFVYHARTTAKLLGLPALPLSPNLFPLPSPVDIRIGKPIMPNENLFYDSPDKDVAEEVYKIEKKIKEMMTEGLQKRRSFWANNPLKDWMK